MAPGPASFLDVVSALQAEFEFDLTTRLAKLFEAKNRKITTAGGDVRISWTNPAPVVSLKIAFRLISTGKQWPSLTIKDVDGFLGHTYNPNLQTYVRDIHMEVMVLLLQSD